MIKLTITDNIKLEYIKTLREVLVTAKRKEISASTKRFYNLCKSIGIDSYLKIYNEFLINENVKNSIRVYGIQVVEEKYYDIYNDFRKIWAFKLVDLLGLATCPYCNRNFTVNFDKNGTTVELDHFYPKNQYPYLAISLYNLIPVCHTCNHKKKEHKLKIYPYEESYNEYVNFSFNINQAEVLLTSDVDIKYKFKKNDKKSKKKINNYHMVLNIPSLYDNHKDIVLELIQKREIYPDSYIDELMQNFDGKVFGNRDELMRLITCGYINDEDINKRPLSKLIKDISEELELI